MPSLEPTATPYGQIVTLYDIEQAVISQLKAWIVPSLAEIERQAGVAPQTIPVPPDDQSFTGGIDFDTWQAEYTPALITAVAPMEPPETESGRTYNQMFEIRVAAIVQADDENTARNYAQWYGSAIAMALVQHGSLGEWPNGNSVAQDTEFQGYPTLDFPDPDPLARKTVRVTVTVHSYVDGVLSGWGAPQAPPNLPYQVPGAYPEVESVSVEVVGESL